MINFVYFIAICLTFFSRCLMATHTNFEHAATGKVPILHLSGKPYELGLQHGQRLKEAIAYNVKRVVDDRILANQEHPQIKSFLAQLPEVLTYVPDAYMDELKGLSDGAGIPLDKILILNLFPEMFHCIGLTVTGEAAKEGKLYHVRVLDYSAGVGLQDTAVLLVVQPEGKIPFLNMSYAGFIGTVTGMNAEKIALGEIGGKGYGQYLGMPMAFLLRTILEQASHLEDVEHLLRTTKRTCEYYYIFSDGKTNGSFGVYATGDALSFIAPGTRYALFERNRDITSSKILLSASQMTSSAYQTVLYHDDKGEILGLIHDQPFRCLALTGFSHPERYPILLERIREHYGNIGVSELQEIIKAPVSRQNNLHNAIFAPGTLDVWISQAGPNNEPAADQPYEHFNLGELLSSSF